MRIKEQETHLTLQEHDDDDDDIYIIYYLTHYSFIFSFSAKFLIRDFHGMSVQVALNRLAPYRSTPGVSRAVSLLRKIPEGSNHVECYAMSISKQLPTSQIS